MGIGHVKPEDLKIKLEIICFLYCKIIEQNLKKLGNTTGFINQHSWREAHMMTSTWKEPSFVGGDHWPEESNFGVKAIDTAL